MDKLKQSTEAKCLQESREEESEMLWNAFKRTLVDTAGEFWGRRNPIERKRWHHGRQWEWERLWKLTQKKNQDLDENQNSRGQTNACNCQKWCRKGNEGGEISMLEANLQGTRKLLYSYAKTTGRNRGRKPMPYRTRIMNCSRSLRKLKRDEGSILTNCSMWT